MKLFTNILFTIIIISSLGTGINCQSYHPNLILTKADVIKIKKGLNSAPLFEESLQKVQLKIDRAIEENISVPFPKDAGGGYTHEKHKQNYGEMYEAGILYQLTMDSKYLLFIRKMLDEYAELYPSLEYHPQGKKQTPGKLFWQSLNETVWLLHTIQAYDCIYDSLAPEERDYYEKNIFIPMTEYFMNECRREFDLIHNHGTWIVAAVGMTGFVLGNEDYVNKSLYGYNENGESGFLAQLDKLFSPDGYYTEGGYYARYALWPFFIFAESIKNNRPELNIYGYRDNILQKAFQSALQVTYTNGEFIPVNDALKEKTWLTQELIFASNFTYTNYDRDKKLLNLVKLHDQVSLSGSGFEVAMDIEQEAAIPPFEWKSVEYSDGPNGDQGGIAILRKGNNQDQTAILLKYGSHGLSHGHFDKLGFLMYDQGREIIQDYGAARFLNIEQKDGGRYLPENKSYAKQTIAHNTVTVDGKSQFNGVRKLSEKYHSNKYAVNISNPNFQYASAKENNAYENVYIHRTIALLSDSLFSKPIIIDVNNIVSDNIHQYDLPYYYKGHFLSTSFEYQAFTESKTRLGSDNGYQHLWKDAEGNPEGTLQFTWLNGKRFYTLTSNTDMNSTVLFTQIGASDPNFNLRNEPGIIIRQKAKSHCFVSVIEPHGSFDPISEKTVGSKSLIKDVSVVKSDTEFTIINIHSGSGHGWNLCIANNDVNDDKEHKVKINNKNYKWYGPVGLIKL
jgi:hypothetical protein